MRAMKDSGIEWIGEIPQEWSTIRLRSRFSFGKGLPITKADLTESGIGVVSYGQIHSKANIGTTIKPELIRYVDCKYLNSNASSLVNNGDFIFADTSEDISGCGNCVYVDANGPLFAGYHTMILRPVEELSTKYYSYLFATDAWRSQIRAQASGVKLFSITQKMLRDALLIEPSEEEKVQIVKYLDEKCEAIDALITAKEKTNALLKERRQSIIYEAVTKGLNPDAPMKDSGVEWIGEIPEHWKVSRLKVIAEMQTGTTPKTSDSDFFDGDVNWFTPADFSGNMLINESERKLTQKAIEEGQVHLFPANTIMLVGIGATVGKTAFTQVAASCNQQITAILIKEPDRAKYYAYWLSACSGTIKATANYTTLPIINNQHLGETFSPYANSVDEQTEITEYLDRTCAGIDRLISANEATIQKLKEYRQSIIYEAVTGKIEV